MNNNISRRGFTGLLAAGALGGVATLAGCSFVPQSGGAAKGTGTFTYYSWGTALEGKGVDKAVQAFGKAKSLKTASVHVVGTSYGPKINALLAANTPPAAGYLDNGMAMQLGAAHKLVSATNIPGFDDWLPLAKHFYSATGAVSYIAPETFPLLFSKKAVEAAGVTPPVTSATAWTWDDFVQVLDKLTKDDNGRSPSESGFDPTHVQQYGFSVPTDSRIIDVSFASNGVELFGHDGNEFLIDTDAAIDVLQKFADLIFVHRVAPSSSQSNTLGASPALLLQSGRVAMTIGGTWSLLDLAPMASTHPYGVGVAPSFGTPFAGVVGGIQGVFANTKYSEDALEFASYLADPTKVPLYSDGLWLPTEKKYYSDEAYIKQWVRDDVHTPSFRTAVLEPLLSENVTRDYSCWIKNYSNIGTNIDNAIAPLFAQQTDIKSRMTQLASRVKPLLQGTYPDTRA